MISKSLTITLFILAISAISATSPQHKWKVGCPNSNPFLARLSISTFSSPKKGVSGHYCSEEWLKYGTCCDENQVTSLQAGDAGQFSVNIDNAMREMSTWDSGIRDFIQKVQRMAFSTPMSNGDNDYTNRCNRVREILQRPAVTKMVRDVALESPLDQSSFTNNLRQCFSVLTTARKNIMCHVCSGRAQGFFDSNGNSQIHPTLCGQLIDNCRNTLSKMYRYVQIVKDHRGTFDEIRNLGIRISSDARLEPGAVDRVWAAIQADDLIRTMDSYTPNGDKNARNSLCQAWVNFGRNTNIGNIVNEIPKIAWGLNAPGWTVMIDGYINAQLMKDQGTIDAAVSAWRRQNNIPN